MKRVYRGAEIEPIYCMTRIGRDTNQNRLVSTDPDANRAGDPYFKVYDSSKFQAAEHIARISFLEPKYIYHVDRHGKKDFKLNSSDKSWLIRYMQSSSEMASRLGITNWDFAKYSWNESAELLDDIHLPDKYSGSTLDAYIDGYYDSILGEGGEFYHASYVPSTAEIPNYRSL